MSSCSRLLCCLFLCFSSVLAVAQAKTHHHRWEISYQFKSPDCVRKLAVAFNGQTPGPTIRATQGDTVVVAVTNSLLTENVAMHWHGIPQIGTPWADGTEGVTQCPILPGDTFSYRFVVDRPGTHTYHAHKGVQHSVELNGMIAVSVPARDTAMPFANREHTEHVAVRWHGIREIGTPLADGTEGVMQCPVLPADPFMVDRPGTYHAHNGVQHSVELNGMIAVYVPAAGLSNMKRTMVVVSLPESAEAEALVRDGEHAGLVDYWSQTQAAGAATAVPLFFAVELAQGILLIALINKMQVALDDQRKKNGGRAVAMALLLLLIIPTLVNGAMAARQFHDGGHDQATARPIDVAPGLMPESKAAANHL